jgi:ATP synthase protein I
MADENGQAPFGDFDTRLKRARDADPDRRPEREQRSPGLRWGGGLTVGIELFAGVLGGLLLGYGLDSWLGTRPLFLIAFFLLGAVAGMLNAYRYLRRAQREDTGA